MKLSPIDSTIYKLSIKVIVLSSISIFILFFLSTIPAFAQTLTTQATQTNTKTTVKTNTPAPEIDYAVLNSLDKAKLIMVIRCLTTKGVNTDQAIESCLPIVSKPPLNPTKKDISAVPTVKVIYPNGGEKLTEGATVRIKYSAGQANTVDIKLWSSLSPTVDLATNLSPEGFYDWKVRALSGYNADYAIGVRAKNANGSTYDISDQYIKIVKPAAPVGLNSTSTTRTSFINEEQAANAQAIIEKLRNIISIFPF